MFVVFPPLWLLMLSCSLVNSCLNILTIVWMSYTYLRNIICSWLPNFPPKSLRLLLMVISQGDNQQKCSQGRRNLKVTSGLCGLFNPSSRLFSFQCYSVWETASCPPKSFLYSTVIELHLGSDCAANFAASRGTSQFLTIACELQHCGSLQDQGL